MLAKYTDNSIFRKVPFNELHGEDITKAAEKNDPIASRIISTSKQNFA